MRFALLLILLSSILANAQSPYRVLPWRSELSFNNYLVQEVHAQYDKRKATVQRALSSRASLLAYRDSCQQRYKQILGAFPERTELKPVLTGAIQKQGYKIEKVVYESLPRHHVTANFYIPDGRGSFPAVLLLCGHEPQGKAADVYQKTAALLALNGFAVLVVDPIAQSERNQLVDNTGKPLTRGGTTEHTLINAVASLVGTSTAAFELWDNMRGIDFLESRPEVDKNRIGCAGNSSGGTQASYLIAFDDRIKVAATCSYMSSRERNFDLIGANDGCQHIVNEGMHGLEISDYSIMFAPKPLLILAGRYDFIDYTGTLRATAELKDVYKVLNVSEKFDFFASDEGHGITRMKREVVVTWFRKWLYNDAVIVKEKEAELIKVEDLSCTSSGQVSSSFTEEFNDQQRITAIASTLKQNRVKNKIDLKNTVKRVMNISHNPAIVSVEEFGQVDKPDYIVKKYIVRKDHELPLPVIAIYPSESYKRVVLWLHDNGKHKIADSTELIKDYLKNSTAIVMADLAGFGELSDPEQLNDPKYFNREYRNAIAAIHIGSSLQAERTKNIIVLTDFIKQQEKLKKLPLHALAKGKATTPLLHAAVIDDRIDNVSLFSGISSFEELIKRAEEKDAYSQVIPNVLHYYDIADLKGALGKRLLTE